MDKIVFNEEMLSRLINELSEINSKIGNKRSIESSKVPFGEGRWRYMYGFNPDSAVSKKDYRRYVIFISTVNDLLVKFGIHRSNYGFNYIVESVKIITDLGSLDIRLINDIYPLIAAQFKCKDTALVEHNIRNAIGAAYKDYENDPSSNMMGIFSRRPTNKEFIIYITEQVWRVMMNAEVLNEESEG